MTNPLKVGVIGYGYWGPNLVRNFTASPHTDVVAVADRDPGRRKAVAAIYPWAARPSDAEALLADPSIEAVAIATPLATHHPLAKAALEAGKHVLIEKPLASSVAQCEELIALAAARGLVLMVDHTFVYTGAVRKIREVIESGQLGRILYFDSIRINLGLFQPDFNVLWDLAPHDLSILDYALGGKPRWVQAVAARHYEGHHENLAYLTIGLEGGVLAHVHVNWVAPVKTRLTTIAGTDRMLVYDDANPAERLKIYESGVDLNKLEPELAHRMNIQYRTGDVLVPKLDPTEALRRVVDEFAGAIRERRAPLSDGAAGLRVVRVLEAAQRSIEASGARVELS
jgi:predicted dehydrogenase